MVLDAVGIAVGWKAESQERNCDLWRRAIRVKCKMVKSRIKTSDFNLAEHPGLDVATYWDPK